MTRRSIMVLVTAGTLILAQAGSTAFGQGAPAGATSAGKIYTRNMSFQLPIALDGKERSKIQSVQLYVRNGLAEKWMLRDSAAATQTEFDYSVTQDGEYWFTIVTLKKNDKLTPADMTRMVPGLIVVVDSQPPELAIRARPITGQGVSVECKVQDANPDGSRLKLEYQTASRSWQVLTSSVQDATVFSLPGPVLKESIVRATATDKAGNTTMRVVHLDTAVALTAGPKAKESIAVPDVLENGSDKPPPMTIADRQSVAPPLAEQPKIQPALADQPKPSPAPAEQPRFPATTGVISDQLRSPTPLAEPASIVPGKQLINSSHATLEYQIEQQGPTGVGKVEVYVTRDEGQSYRRLCEDPDHRSPAELDLPGEGLYGVSLVVTNGSGFGGKPPARGDAPDYWIEVDTSKPAAQILSVKSGTGDNGGVLLISWVANDKNLGEMPVDLSYATRPSGPWQPVAKGLKNDGNYRWSLTQEVGPEIYVRLTVTDRAGNSEQCDTPQPLVVDMAKPKARVLRIRAGNSSSP